MSQNKIKSKTVSFRVSEHIITQIEKDAKTKLISTNVLINQILLDYVSWHRYQKRMRTFPISEEALVYFLDALNESQRNEAIEIAFNSLRDWVLVSKKKFDLHSCLEALEDYCRLAGISVEDTLLSEGHSFVVRHNLSVNASLFISEFIKKVFWEIKKVNVETQLTKTMVISKPLSRID